MGAWTVCKKTRKDQLNPPRNHFGNWVILLSNSVSSCVSILLTWKPMQFSQKPQNRAEEKKNTWNRITPHPFSIILRSIARINAFLFLLLEFLNNLLHKKPKESLQKQVWMLLCAENYFLEIFFDVTLVFFSFCHHNYSSHNSKQQTHFLFFTFLIRVFLWGAFCWYFSV